MPLLVDAHADLAYNILRYGRDYTRPAAETRRLESGSQTVEDNGDTLLGWDDYQRGQVALVFATLFATPVRFRKREDEPLVYRTYDEARQLYLDQLDVYRRLADSSPDKFQLIASNRDLDLLLDHWASPAPGGHPVGMVVLMEGAEAVRQPSKLEMWREQGVRLIGPAWVGTRYCGGWREPGPLTGDGRKLLAAMEDFNFILDLSHMDERAALEALDVYAGPIVATHANCAALMPNANTNRHLPDRVIEGIVERDGVVGIVPFNAYLKAGWARGQNSRDEVPLEYVVNHIDHVCQLAGDSSHVGIGTDFDGGFGVQSVPPEIDTIADLQNLVSLLRARGYSDADVENIFSVNWLTRLKRNLP